MACQTKSASKGDKGVGTRLFVDFTSCTHVADPAADPLTLDTSTDNDYTEVNCITEITPPGMERAEEQDDGCLGEDLVVTDVGPQQLTSATATIRYVPGDTVDQGLRAAHESGDDIAIVIKHPAGSTYVYEWFDAKVTQVAPQSIGKRTFRTATIRLTPQMKSGFAATAAHLGTGLT
jgi:hypothetical protein